MALTRKMLRDLGIESDAIDAIIAGNAETVDALKDEIAKKQSRIDELEAKQKDGTDWKERYDSEHEAFEAFKAESAKKADDDLKASLYRKLLEAAGVDPKRIDRVMKVTDLSELSVKDGKLEDEDKLSKGIESEWADFILSQPQTKGVNVPTPPANSGKAMTRDEIMKIKDTQERQQAIADNIDQFI